jgi:hypothetical protein
MEWVSGEMRRGQRRAGRSRRIEPATSDTKRLCWVACRSAFRRINKRSKRRVCAATLGRFVAAVPDPGHKREANSRAAHSSKAYSRRARQDRCRRRQRACDQIAYRPHGPVLRSARHRADGRGFGTAINRRLERDLVRRAFDSCRPDAIDDQARQRANKGHLCSKHSTIIETASRSMASVLLSWLKFCSQSYLHRRRTPNPSQSLDCATAVVNRDRVVRTRWAGAGLPFRSQRLPFGDERR